MVSLNVGAPTTVNALPGVNIFADDGLLNVTSTPALPITVSAPITKTT
jgi:hypothetical protein